ncbi:MAG TPA: DUF5666 domain-containing protein [Holophagaceae bacterium]
MSPIKWALIGGLSLLLTACGGASASRSSQGTATAPVALSGQVAGTAAAPTFNGQALMTGGATVILDGSPATATRIQPGVVLRGSATSSPQGLDLVSADLEHELEGPIASLDLSASTFVVLGRTVQVGALTQIVSEGPGDAQTPLTLADLKVGDFVEVYGSEQADGSIRATRVERQAPEVGAQDVFHGTVSALDAGAMTFQAGGFLVSYSGATVQGSLADGARVEVRGTASGQTFTATWIAVETAAGDAGMDLELSGPLSGLDATAKTFMLMSFKVNYSAAEVEGTLAEGAQVEVEGTAGPAGSMTMTAREVKVIFPEAGSGDSNLEVSGTVSAVDAAAGTITVGSATYWTDAATLFVKDDAPVTLGAISLGDTVEIHVLSTRTNASGQAYATLVVVSGP